MYLPLAGFFALALGSPSRLNKQYREDYVYNPTSDAFYKLHIESVWYRQAKSACQTEGAQLMFAGAPDIRQLHGMLKDFPDIRDQVWVASDGLSHESAEEQPIINLQENIETGDLMPIKGDCEVLNRQGEVQASLCYRRLPFICKVEAVAAPYDPICKVHSKEYQYYESVGSCYKISRAAYSWNQAYEECRAEGSHLVILNSEAERGLVYNITNAAPPVEDVMATWFFFAGIRAHKTTNNVPRIFKTVFNQTLDQAGFAEWSPGEPNNTLGNEYCGTIFKNDGKYNDVDCAHMYAFICEKEITALNNSL